MTAATRLRRVRVHGNADPGLARSRLGSLLAGGVFRPPGLEPSAVLFIRRLPDPLPGTLRLESADARPPPEWERALLASLERVLRGAARPARGAVPASAEAVLFADRAELLACFARDHAGGTAWLNWWWSDLVLSGDVGDDPVAGVWLQTPEHVPAALELLAATHDAVRVVSTLREPAAAGLAGRVAVAHGVESIAELVATPSIRISRVREPSALAIGTARPGSPPWRRHVPETRTATLLPVSELLLGVSLVLRRAPGYARTPSFAAAAREWFAAARVAATEVDGEGKVEAATRDDAAASVSRSLRVERRERTGGPPPAAGAIRSPAGEPFAPPPDRERLPGAPLDQSDQTIRELARPFGPRQTPSARARRDAAACPGPATEMPPHGATATPGPTPPRTVEHVAAASSTHAARPQPARRDPVQPGSPERQWETAPQRAVETQLGGVFYLLILALSLGLYADFTRPTGRNLSLDPWDLLRLLGPRLLDEPARDDPVWGVLAGLSGNARPGRGFRPPRTWRTPSGWLEPFEHRGVWCWSAAGGVLRLVHPHGFAVVAVPRTDDPPGRQLAREVHRLRPLCPDLRRATLRPEPARPLTRWTARLLPYADARLRRGLGIDSSQSLDRLLLRHRARVVVTATHVDVAFRLVDLPLAIRFAGLDRTPGWIPATGRFVAFHFE